MNVSYEELTMIGHEITLCIVRVSTRCQNVLSYDNPLKVATRLYRSCVLCLYHVLVLFRHLILIAIYLRTCVLEDASQRML